MARELLMLGATMIAMTTSIPRGEYASTADQRLFMRIGWSDYEALDAMRGDKARPRITYLDGVAELMSPSNDREHIKSQIGRLVEAFCVERKIDINAYGSWTLKSKPDKAAAEADECYIFGVERKDRPDLAIEVVWTSGGLDKLEVYRRLGVGEVWFWIDGAITVHVLTAAGYEPRCRSEALPDLDLDVLLELIACPTINQLVARMQAYARSLG